MSTELTYERTLLEEKGCYDLENADYLIDNSLTNLSSQIKLLFPGYLFFLRLIKTNCFLQFPNNTLTEEEILSLNTLIETVKTQFSANGLYIRPKYKIESLYNTSRSFDPDKSYDVLGMHKKPTINEDGLLSTMEYYKEYDSETSTFSDLIVKEENVYTLNELGLVSQREKTISFYLEDNTIGYSKNILKYYDTTTNFKAVREEADTRRKNLVYKAELYILSALTYSDALTLLASVVEQRTKYIVGIKTDLLTALQNDSLYLSEENKQIIISILDR